MTSGERVSVLEGQLEESMSTYDGMILRERDYVLSRSNRKGSEDALEKADAAELPYDEGADSGAGGAGGSSPYGEPGVAGASAEGTSENQSTSSGGGTRPGGNASRDGDYQHAGSAAPPPADIPDGSDDDVVARQIREAAMQETDPQLREKLWEEYRKYKNQGR